MSNDGVCCVLSPGTAGWWLEVGGQTETGVRLEDNNRILSYYLIVEVQLAF